MFELATLQMLSLFPSAEAIKRGDKDYHKAVNIASEMHARYPCLHPDGVPLEQLPASSTGALPCVDQCLKLTCIPTRRAAHWNQGGW